MDASRSADQLIEEMGWDETIVYGVAVGILLLLGLVLTFKGKKYFKRLMTTMSFIVGAVTPLYLVIYHKKFSVFSCSPFNRMQFKVISIISNPLISENRPEK